MKERLLFISPNRFDAGQLTRMLGPTGVAVEHTPNFAQARDRLLGESFAVVLTEAQLAGATWTDVLNLAQQLPHPPVVLVTHRLADHGLWAEVLNLGAYDLLAQPFDSSEVQRIVTNACLQSLPRKAVAPRTLHAGRALAQGAY